MLYEIDAGLSGRAKAKTSGGVAPGGSFVTEISAETAGHRSHRRRRNRRNQQERERRAPADVAACYRSRSSALVLALALPACGSAASTRLGASAGCRPARPPADGRPGAKAGGVGLKKIGDFDTPVYVAGAPGVPRLLFVVEQGGKSWS